MLMKNQKTRAPNFSDSIKIRNPFSFLAERVLYII
jgi:hypothetical protein